MNNKKTTYGFTLAEMLVAIAIIGAVSGLVVQSFSDFRASFKRTDAKQTFESDVLRIRNEAVSRGARSLIVINSDGSGYSAGIDFTPFNSSGAIDQTLFQRKFPYGVTAILSQPVVFDTRGYLVNLSGQYTTTGATMILDGSTFYSHTIYMTGAIQ